MICKKSLTYHNHNGGKTMLNILKIALAVTLFTGTLMAEGQMGSGGRGECTGETCPPPCTENCGRPIEADTDSEPITIRIVKAIGELYFVRF
jgi:hypothetical protein